MDAPSPFLYSTALLVRRHGPAGYADYESYRDWLRDEFCFRCVYCLRREIWTIRLGGFQLDHFIPQAHDPSRALDYDNLVYACNTCNTIKAKEVPPNPAQLAYGNCIRVNGDGTIEWLLPQGRSLIRRLRLDGPDHTRFRRLIIETLQSLWKNGDDETVKQWLCFPDDLPDLSRAQPPKNVRPQGIAESYFSRRARGELPETY